MKVSGFSFIRNAVKLDYPIVEAIKSILPICDEFVIAVGKSEDETLALIQSINSPKLKIIETIWDDRLRKGGKVLALETDKALQHISKNSDWAFYIQGDEVIHEKYLSSIQDAMKKWKDEPKVEGLLFNYKHFYASYQYVANSRNWYKNEIRIIRNLPEMQSFRDAQGFRLGDRKIKVKHIEAYIYHYGWVKHPDHQRQKQRSFHSLYHNEEWLNLNKKKVDEFDYSGIESLKRFTGSHPKVIQKRVNKMNWELNFDPKKSNFSVKSRLLHKIENFLGWRIGEFKNYKII